jgi:hypothetical protein
VVRVHAPVTNRGETIMREWMYVLSPFLIVTYFAIYPGQFHDFMIWFGRMLLH